MKIPRNVRTKKLEGAAAGKGVYSGPDFIAKLVALLLARLLPAALACNGFFHAFLFARLEVEGVPLNLLDYVLLLDLTFEAPQGVFEGLTLLNPYFCQSRYTT